MAGERITLRDRVFERVIPYETIASSVAQLGRRITEDYKEREMPLFVGVLNGSFMFMSELMRSVDLVCEVSFVKLASYRGIRSSGEIAELIGLACDIEGRHVVVVEDIVDTGGSIDYVMRSIAGLRPASVEVATLLFKPEAYTGNVAPKYAAMEIPDEFVVGFGLDYDQAGRNLKDIYRLADE